MENSKYIYLYADEFTSDAWATYCKILGLPVSSIEIKVTVASAEALN